MASADCMLNTQHHIPCQAIDADKISTTPINRHALDAAMDKVALAVAALQRAGPRYCQSSEAFWFFAAGCWSDKFYHEQVKAAGDRLPIRVSVHDDVRYAKKRVGEAVALLKKDGDVRDAEDLDDALGEFVKGGDGW